jgi:hypothetical protein
MNQTSIHCSEMTLWRKARLIVLFAAILERIQPVRVLASRVPS